MKKLDVIFLASGIIAFLVYIIFFVDLNSFVSTLAKIDVVVFLAVIALSLLEIAAFTTVFVLLLRTVDVVISFMKALSYVLASIFVDLVIPGESVTAEISRVYFLSKYENAPAGRVASSVFLQRAMGMMTTTVLLLTSLLLLNLGNLLHVVVLVTILTAVATAIIVILCLKPNSIEFFKRLALKVLKFFKREGLNSKVEDFSSHFLRAMQSIATRRERLLVPILVNAFSWMCSLGLFYLAFISLGYTPDWRVIIFVYTFVLALKLPIGPMAEFGTPEIAMTALLVFFNVPSAVALATTIIVRMSTVWLRFLLGFITYNNLVIRKNGKQSLIGSLKGEMP
jgi:uncharacterized protein (TIRG00374 family)